MPDEREILRSLPEAQDTANMFFLLEKDLEAFKLAVLNQANETTTKRFVRRASLLLNKKNKAAAGPDIYGEELGVAFPVKSTLDCVNRLKVNAADSQARLELIENFAIKGIKGHLGTYRNVFLHAMYEAGNDVISTERLRIAALSQRRYIDKLISFLIEEITLSKNKAKENKAKGGHIAYLDRMEDSKKKVQFLKDISSLIRPKPVERSFEAHVNDLLTTEKPSAEVIQNVLVPMTNAMVSMPLLKDSTQFIIECLKKLLPTKPYGFFYDSRLHRSMAKLMFCAYSNGYRDKGKECLKQLTYAMTAINNAIQMVGANPQSKIDRACIREYALICFSIHQQSPMLGHLPPSDHLQRMEEAIKMLALISEEPGVIELETALGKAISKATGGHDSNQEEAAGAEQSSSEE